MSTHILKGHFRQGDGQLESGRLRLERTANGDFLDRYQHKVSAWRYTIAGDLTGVQVESAGAVWEFLPDDGECERVGMPIQGEGDKP